MTSLMDAGPEAEVFLFALFAVACAAAAITAGIHTVQAEIERPWRLLLAPLAGVGGLLTAGAVLLTGWSEPGLASRATSHGAVFFLGPLLVAPAMGLGALGLIWLGVRTPRRWPQAVVPGLIVVAAVSTLFYGGLGQTEQVFSVVRGTGLGVIGLAVVAASLRQGSDVRALAVAWFCLAVAVSEASQQGLITMLIGQQFEAVPQEKWGEAVDLFRGAVLRSRPKGSNGATGGQNSSLELEVPVERRHREMPSVARIVGMDGLRSWRIPLA